MALTNGLRRLQAWTMEARSAEERARVVARTLLWRNSYDRAEALAASDGPRTLVLVKAARAGASGSGEQVAISSVDLEPEPWRLRTAEGLVKAITAAQASHPSTARLQRARSDSARRR